MATRDFSTYFLYRWRYVIGYSAIALLLAGVLLFAGLYLPGGLSSAEHTSVIQSAALTFHDPQTLAIANLPYYAFQSLILSLFGISVLTVKLPSLILALLSAIGLILLLRRWFTPNIAVLASLIAVATGQFLYIAQSGTPSILYIFWPVTLLLLGTYITRAEKHRFIWKILFTIGAALSLYTPLGVYPLIAVGLAVVFHPHLRAIIRRLKRHRLFTVGAIFAVLIAPLVWLIAQQPSLATTLLIGTPPQWPPEFTSNALTLLQQYFFFWSPGASEFMTPVFGLGAALLITIGLYRLILTRETTRSYLIIFWTVCIAPVLLINPQFTSVTFTPSVLMMAAGLTSLISYWYRLFPRNPYARVTGLVPIIVLVAALISTGLVRYAYGYHYNPQIAPLFSRDIRMLPKEPTQLIVTPQEKPFFSAVARYHTSLDVSVKPTEPTILVTRQARTHIKGYTITKIITNERSNDADRFYLMRRSS